LSVAIKPEIAATAQSGLFFNFVKKVLAVDEAISDKPGTNVGQDDEFNRGV